MSTQWIQDTLAQFGQQLGLPDLSLGEGGAAELSLQAGGMLAVEPAPQTGDVLVYLGRPIGFDGPTVLRNALARAHHGMGGVLPVQVALRGDGPEALLLVLARIPERDFTLAALSRVVDYLGRWSDGVRHG
ncbi:hypothetical protein [Diaphorobacter nitroreducens]|uniref:hypothetical protein n=1 Tax=Diaphorobacter nitroreducens TaxID=164759 RepID=UPI0035AFC38E